MSIYFENLCFEKAQGLQPSPENTANGTDGAILHVDFRGFFAGDLECVTELLNVEDTGLSRILRVKVGLLSMIGAIIRQGL